MLAWGAIWATSVVVEGLRGNERLVVNPGDDLASGMQVVIGGQDHASTLAHQ